jgi:hypothetical protein
VLIRRLLEQLSGAMGGVGFGEEAVEPVVRLIDVPNRLGRDQQRNVEDDRAFVAADIENLEAVTAIVDTVGDLAAGVVVRVGAEQYLRATDDLL